jgi:hypothetical protein
MKDILEEIASLNRYTSTFATLAKVDRKSAAQLRAALLKATEKSHSEIIEAADNPDRLRYWIYREAMDVKAHSSSYLLYREMMATREAHLLRFAMDVTNRFFYLVFEALDAYFMDKKKRMFQECEASSRWYSTVSDVSKKLLTPINFCTRLIEYASERLGYPVDIGKTDLVDTKGIVERAYSIHLDSEQVAKDLTKMLEKASAQVQEAWKREIQAQALDLTELKAFAAVSTAGVLPSTGFRLGIAEQAFTVDIGAGVAGAFRLAAGWQVLSSAVLDAFPPRAIFSLLAAAGMAFLTKDRALKARRRQIRTAVNEYHRQLLMELESKKMDELGRRTIREAMEKENRRMVAATVRHWEESISGKLRAAHYRLLVAATTQHLMLIDKALTEVEAERQAEHEVPVH